MAGFLSKLLLLSFLYLISSAAQALEAIKVAENVYALVGPLEQRSAQNLGNNATFGVIVTRDGVILVDPGGSAKGAARIEAAIAKLTDKPVKVVINTGGQDHRWFGNHYFKASGATVIASEAAVEDQKERSDAQWQMMDALIGTENLKGTDLIHADTVFDERHSFMLGSMHVEVIHAGQAHTPGDSFVWLPEQKILFSGDIVYMDRMLGIFTYSNSKSWLAAFGAVESLEPSIVVPGHGKPAPLVKAQAETRDYVMHLRKQIRALIEAGGSMIDAKEIDQSAFRKLALFDQLSRRNAQAVFVEMEFE
jgi:glyoxylase-like metal-dependent hydrolase (beta-lactamase superfamily II)